MNTESFMAVFVELLAKSALIALAATIFLRAWRGATAAQRHLVWFVALTVVMLLPLTRLIAPFWKIPLTPATKARVVMSLPPIEPSALVELDTPVTEPAAALPVRRPFNWRLVVLGVWGGGAALLFGYRLLGSWRLHRLLRRSMAADDPRIRLLLSRTLSEVGLRRRPAIRFSEECRVPITWGSLRPVMLLPKAALQWSDTWILAALRHEAAHIGRYDYLTRWFAHVACALYWPNPLVWLLARSLRVAQELAADDLVLRAGTPPEEYASQLVDAARNVTAHGFFVRQAVAMACPSTLEHRVRAIVDGGRDRRPLSRVAVACGSVTIAIALGLSTAAQLRSDEEKPVAPPPGNEPKAEAKGLEIEIAAKFIEISSRPGAEKAPETDGSLSQLAQRVTEGGANKFTIFSDPQFQVVIRALNQRKGVDLLAAPKITARTGQPGKIEIVREFRYPIEWEKDGAKWKPTKYETKNLGISLEVEPHLAADGSINVHEAATFMEFMGFVPLDGEKAAPAEKKGANENGSVYPPVPEGQRSKPVFAERKSEQTVKLKSGETVAIGDLPARRDRDAGGNDLYEHKVLIFISPRIIAPAPEKPASKEGEAAASAPANPRVVVAPELGGKRDQAAQPGLQGRILAINDKWNFVVLSMGAKQGVVRDASVVVVRGKDTIARLRVTEVEPSTSIADVLPGTVPQDVSLRPGDTAIVEDNREKGSVNLVADQKSAPPDAGLITKEWKLPYGVIPTKTDGADAVFAKDWLISKGVKFESGGTAIFVPSTSRLVVRNTQEQLDLVDQIVNAAVAKGDKASPADPGATASGKPAPGGGESVARQKAEKIIIPVLEFREATLNEALEFLRKKSVDSDPEKTGLKIVLKPGTSSDARITMSLRNVPVIEALHYITGLAELEFVLTPDALIVQPTGNGASGGAAAPLPVPNVGAAGAGAGVESAALAKASRIIIPKIELREATLAEAVDFLRAKAMEIDPDGKGVNILVKAEPANTARITMSLTDIPLVEAVRYVASLANLELVIGPDALIVQPIKPGAASGGGTPADTNPVEHQADPAKPKEDKERVELTADAVHQTDTVAVAEGHACLKCGEQTMKADTIRYDHATRQVDLTGKVEIRNNLSVIQAERVILSLTPGGQMKIEGPHKVNMLPAPGGLPPATMETAPKASELVVHAQSTAAPPAATPAPVPTPATPRDIYLEAYMAFAKSEKLTSKEQTGEAIELLQSAGRKLDGLAKLFPNWQPQIVEYRKARVAEALQRLQGKL